MDSTESNTKKNGIVSSLNSASMTASTMVFDRNSLPSCESRSISRRLSARWQFVLRNAMGIQTARKRAGVKIVAPMPRPPQLGSASQRCWSTTN